MCNNTRWGLAGVGGRVGENKFDMYIEVQDLKLRPPWSSLRKQAASTAWLMFNLFCCYWNLSELSKTLPYCKMMYWLIKRKGSLLGFEVCSPFEASHRYRLKRTVPKVSLVVSRNYENEEGLGAKTIFHFDAVLRDDFHHKQHIARSDVSGKGRNHSTVADKPTLLQNA